MSGEREPLLGHAGTSRSRGHGSTSHGSPTPERDVDIEFEEEDEDSLREASTPTTMKQYIKRCCNVQDAKNKFPIIKWLPKYT